MLRLVIFFLVVSLIAGALGFTGISEAAAGTAKIVFYIFVGLFGVSLLLLLFNK